MTDDATATDDTVEAAAQTMWTVPLGELHAEDRQVAVDVAREMLAAARPLIERQVREQIADEIERFIDARPNKVGYLYERNSTLRCAAQIARGSVAPAEGTGT